MDAAGFQSTKIICGDDTHTFACAPSMLNDPTLMSIVDGIGSHGMRLKNYRRLHNATVVQILSPTRQRSGRVNPCMGLKSNGQMLVVLIWRRCCTQSILIITSQGKYETPYNCRYIFWNTLTAYLPGLFAWDAVRCC
jgi:hypothetical protein